MLVLGSQIPGAALVLFRGVVCLTQSSFSRCSPPLSFSVFRSSERGSTRAGNAQGTPTQSHISPRIQDHVLWGRANRVAMAGWARRFPTRRRCFSGGMALSLSPLFPVTFSSRRDRRVGLQCPVEGLGVQIPNSILVARRVAASRSGTGILIRG